MNTFFLDLWHDLREKRLAPVAAVLALALVAVPVLLAKPAEEASAPVVKTSAPKELNSDQLAALAQVKLGEEESGEGSTLGVFDPSNPFKPPKGAIKKEKAASSSNAGPTSGPTSGSGGGGGTSPSDPNGGSWRRSRAAPAVAARPRRPPRTSTSSTSPSRPTAAPGTSRGSRSSTCCRTRARRC